MKIAVIGTGISGLAISYILSKNHQLTIYEKNDYIGGHSRTITPKINEKEVPVDTGFIVFNKKNYPNLVSLFNHLNIEYSESNMSFGVSINSGKLEYGTSNLSSMFAQKRNLFNLQFLLMIKDIFKFYKNAKNYRNIDLTVGQMLEEMKLGEYFKNNFLLPIAASIWSSKSFQILDFPTSTFVNFFDNHGLLSVSNQPQWYSVIGGSKNYVSKLSNSFKDRIHLSRPAMSANRVNEKVEIVDNSGNKELYDNVIFACHSDQTMKIIQDANDEEKKIIGNIKYQKNKIITHTDSSFMPQNKKCWSSWVYLGENNYKNENLCLTYWMNNLQKLNTDKNIFVTVNPKTNPKKDTILDEYEFEHPLFNQKSIEAQKYLHKIQGKDRYWFAGAYSRYGFHEDGILSAIKIAEKMGEKLPW